MRNVEDLRIHQVRMRGEKESQGGPALTSVLLDSHLDAGCKASVHKCFHEKQSPRKSRPV